MTTINEKQFVDKISRLNSSQQSIESLSGWCTFFRRVIWHQETYSILRHLVLCWRSLYITIS